MAKPLTLLNALTGTRQATQNGPGVPVAEHFRGMLAGLKEIDNRPAILSAPDEMSM